MIYKFPNSLQLNYDQVKSFLNDEEELTKEELLERCTGKIDYDLLQSLKELIFKKIGKTPAEELYLL